MPPKFRDVTFNFININTNLSLDRVEARRRVINLYKAWYRQIPAILYDFSIPISKEDARSKLREIYVRNSNISDVKMINNLMLKGQMELNESVNKQKEPYHIMRYFSHPRQVKPRDFLSKFLEGR